MNNPGMLDRLTNYSGKTRVNDSSMSYLRGTLVNRTYGDHKNLYIHLFLPTIFGPIYYLPP